MDEKTPTYSREQLRQLAWISAVNCFEIEMWCMSELQKMRPQIEASLAACEEQDGADGESPDDES